MFGTKSTMDPTSHALWLELRAPVLARTQRRLFFGSLCCLLWLGAGLLYGKSGVLAMVLVWYGLYLPVGFAHIVFGACKDDWLKWFAPAFYMLSPLIGLGIVIDRAFDTAFRGLPLIPTIFTGKGLVKISRDVDDGYGYRFTLASGKSVVIVRDSYDAPCARYYIPFQQANSCGGVVGPVSDLVWYLEYGNQED